MAPPKPGETAAAAAAATAAAAEEDELAKTAGKPKGIADGKSEINSTLPLATLAPPQARQRPQIIICIFLFDKKI